jgi:hypothetical protein
MRTMMGIWAVCGVALMDRRTCGPVNIGSKHVQGEEGRHAFSNQPQGVFAVTGSHQTPAGSHRGSFVHYL